MEIEHWCPVCDRQILPGSSVSQPQESTSGDQGSAMSKDGTTLDATPTIASPTTKIDADLPVPQRASTPSGVRKRVTAGAGKASRPGLRRSKTTAGHVFTKKRANANADVDNFIQGLILPANQSQDDGTATAAKARKGAVEHFGVLRRVESDRPRSPRSKGELTEELEDADTPAAPPVPRIKSSSRLKNGKPRPKAINLSTRPDPKEINAGKKRTESPQSPARQTLVDSDCANPSLGGNVSTRQASLDDLSTQLFCSQACYEAAIQGDSPDTSRPRTPLPSVDLDAVVVKCSELKYDMPWLRPDAIRRRSYASLGFDEEDSDFPFLSVQLANESRMHAPLLYPFGPLVDEPILQSNLGDNRRTPTTTEPALSFRRTPGALQASPTKGSPIGNGKPLPFERSSGHRRRQIELERKLMERRRHTVAFDGVNDSVRPPWWLADEREDWKTYWEARETGSELTYEEWQILRHRKRVENVHQEEQVQRFYQNSQRIAANDHKFAKKPLLIRVASQPMLEGFRAVPSPDRTTPTSPTSQRPRLSSKTSAPLEMTSPRRASAKPRPVSDGLGMAATLSRRSSAGVNEIRPLDDVNADSSREMRVAALSQQGVSKNALRRNRSLKALTTITPAETGTHDLKTVSPVGLGPRSPLGMHSVCAADVCTTAGILQRVDDKKAKRRSLYDVANEVSTRGNPRALPPLIIKEHASVRLGPSVTPVAPQGSAKEALSGSPEAITATSISGSGSSGEESAHDRIAPRSSRGQVKPMKNRPLSTGALINAPKEESTASLLLKTYLPTFGSVPEQATISQRAASRTSLWGIFGSAKN